MSWISVNMALAAVFFTAWCGIPLWMVLRHPSWSHAPADTYTSPAARPAPVAAFGHSEELVAAEAA
jgi:hypothetical protein